MRDEGTDEVGLRLAAHLSALRTDRGWSLEELAGRSGVSRSTLSRLERAEISPTAALLGRLCTVYERSLSRLLAEVETEPRRLVRAGEQTVWRDDASGFTRRSVSPPDAGLHAEVVEAILRPGADIAYDAPPVLGQEQHVWVLDGALELTVDDRVHELTAGDCLRLRLWGGSRFRCPGPEPARYAVIVVLP